MHIPIALIVSFITIFFGIIMLVVGWAYAIITQNTKALKDLAVIVAEIKTKDQGDERLCTEKHKVINHRIDDLEEINNHKIKTK